MGYFADLLKAVDFKCRKIITKVRVSNHRLNIEVGRYRNVVRTRRLVYYFDHNDGEDEFHFIVNVLYSIIVKIYIKKSSAMIKPAVVLRLYGLK